MYEIVHASMKYSRYWSRFRVVKFTKNLRLVAAASDSSSSSVSAQFVEQQKEYLEMLNIIGEGNDPAELPQSSVAEVYGENVQTDGSRIVALPSLNATSDMDEMLAWLFPEGFNPDLMHTRAILAATNTVVDEWNTVIQSLNSNIAYELCSIDKVKDIDDPHGILQRMISESVLERFQRPGVPNHRLVLKKDDICMVMRNLNKREGIAKNTRVKIVNISPYIIRVCTLHPTNPKYYNIPRIRFTVTLPYGRSIKMERRQFPLRLAYSMTYNKSQGQEFDKVCVDIRKHPFTHGHLYVALSRIRIANNLRLFTNPLSNTKTDEFAEPPIVTNVVYKQLAI
jgi:ATP-dependent DNA helicase PIF1